LDPIEDEEFILEINQLIISDIKEHRKQSKANSGIEQLENCIRKTIRKMFKQEINRSPNIIVNIEKIN
jgi:ribonuclease J